MKTPDWLAKRDGAIRLGPDGKTWYVAVEGKPLYRLRPTPAKGGFTCLITETVNGRPVVCDVIAPDLNQAVEMGLDQLGSRLGWK